MESYSWVFCRKCFAKTCYNLGYYLSEWGICYKGSYTNFIHTLMETFPASFFGNGNLFFPPPFLGIKTWESGSYFILVNIFYVRISFVLFNKHDNLYFQLPDSWE